MNYIKKLWDEKPFMLIMFLAIIFRLLAAIFSKGYGMHDDHFLVIEASQSWVDGTDYDNWLPKNQIDPIPQGHSFFYVGLHYLLFTFMKFCGLFNPQVKMLIVRFLHAAFSLITVALGYKITKKISNKETARFTGLLLAILWFMPFMSVRNLVEIFCIPFLMMGTWIIYNSTDDRKQWIKYLAAGLVMGIAFSVRFQTMIYIGGTGIALLFVRKWYHAVSFGAGAVISIILLQGVTDYIIWGFPFAEATEYIRYNFVHKNDYLIGSWYFYIPLIAGIIIPPVGLFQIFGFFRTRRNYLVMFLPTLLFLIFHSIFPNKQERFIFPVIPFFVILGTVGWYGFYRSSGFWSRNKSLMKGGLIFFWVVNSLLLISVTLAYSKKSRCESMTYLSKYKNIGSLLIEDSNNQFSVSMPLYYLGQWPDVYQLAREIPDRAASHFHCIASPEFFRYQSKEKYPDFVLFYGVKNLDSRLKNIRTVFPDLQPETRIDPGFVDRFMTWINPNNKNESVFIFRNPDSGKEYLLK
ncbi:MAG: glycosyltransferase family 39 protein [Bacteroidia bacterium]|nr:glycosyltransferase family 39 protein [Bacteroidia bacterium]